MAARKRSRLKTPDILKSYTALGAWKVPGILLFLAILVITLVLAVNGKYILRPGSQNDSSTVAASGPIVDACSENNTITYTCYKKELTDIVNQKGPEAAIALLKQQYDKNIYVKSQCHQLTHAVGQAALVKYQDLGTAYVHGDYFCASGYFHGISEKIVTEKGADYMINNAESICAKLAKTSYHKLDHYNCVHGIGHGLLEATNGDLFKALKGCDNLHEEWERNSCNSGVFMQNVMIEESPDESTNHKSAYLRDDDLMYPCTVVAEKYKWGCYIFQSSYAITKTGNNFVKVFDLCTSIGPKYRDICYSSLGRDASGISNLDQAKTIALCYLGPSDEAIMFCAEGAAMNLDYTYHTYVQAYAFCDALKETYRYDCRGIAKTYYNTF